MPPVDPKGLADHFAADFPVGAAVNHETIRTHRALIVTHFASITPENEMKWESVHPDPEVYTFDQADAIAAFARAEGLALRGHTLCWHNQTPSWVFTDQNGQARGRTELLGILQAHIRAVASRYRGVADAWDVVNEAVADSGDQDLRESHWLRQVGPDFIAHAFRFAHDADPDARLFYNDYNEHDPVKRERIFRLVANLLEQGVPVHGLGLQAHINIVDPPYDAIDAALRRYASLGIRLEITELDISCFRFGDRRTDLRVPPPEWLEQQAERYRTLFDLYRQYRGQIDRVTLWGVADDRTWKNDFPVRGRTDWPLLFDADHQPKPAFFALTRPASP